MADIIVVKQNVAEKVSVNQQATDQVAVNQKVSDKVAVNPAPVTVTGILLAPATNATLGGIIVGDNLTINANGLLSAQAVGDYAPKVPNVTYGQFSQQGLTFSGETSTSVTNCGTITRDLFSGYSQAPYAGSMIYGGSAVTSGGITTSALMQTDGQTLSMAGSSVAPSLSKDAGMSFSASGVQFSYFEDNANGFKTVEYLLSDTGVRITSVSNDYVASEFASVTFEVAANATYVSTIEPNAMTPNTIMNKEMTESLFITMQRRGA